MNQTDRLAESFADIEALAHRVSWELMDEAQRDEFMTKVVVPRWGKTTADGVTLKGTAWARMLGTDRKIIQDRYYRLTKKDASAGNLSVDSASPTPNQAGSIRSARAAIRKHPELAAELMSDDRVAEAAHGALADRARRQLGLPKQRRKEQRSTRSAFWSVIVDLQAMKRQADSLVRALQEATGELGEDEANVAREYIGRVRAALDLVESLIDHGGVSDEALTAWIEGGTS